jgi:hypothetical protein
MSLPSGWVDRIFEKLTLVYGQAFLRRWEQLDIDKVKADWGKELAGFLHNPDALAFAMQNLPPDAPPPTVLQFRHLAAQAPRKAAASTLPAPPPANPERMRAELAKLKRPDGEFDPKAWAWKLRAREQAGERLTLAQREMWRAALHVELARERIEADEVPA